MNFRQRQEKTGHQSGRALPARFCVKKSVRMNFCTLENLNFPLMAPNIAAGSVRIGCRLQFLNPGIGSRGTFGPLMPVRPLLPVRVMEKFKGQAPRLFDITNAKG